MQKKITEYFTKQISIWPLSVKAKSGKTLEYEKGETKEQVTVLIIDENQSFGRALL